MGVAEPILIIIDLFCGAGGFTEGAEQSGMVKVIIGINHDAKAIESHAANHPETTHFTEDIRTIKLKPLVAILEREKKKHPTAKVLLHASLECTNFSKAKGGQPRDGDSRTLADHLDRYQIALNPDYITIENVTEFRSWGPLDENGKPISKKSGTDYEIWRTRIKSYGYEDEWQELNSADYGAFTSRVRLFGVFAKKGLPIAFPSPTHTKESKLQPLSPLQKWKPVREVLDLTDKGNSILTREKPLSEKTLERIYAGLIKFVAGGKKEYSDFLVKYNSTSLSGKVCAGHGLHEPSPVVSTQARLAIAQPEFIQTYHGNGNNVSSLERPAPTLPTHDSAALVQSEFLSHHYILNPQFANTGNSIDKPCFTIIARMDKRPPYLVETEFGEIAIQVYESDSPMMRNIKLFMSQFGIIDIKMRMLRIRELLRIQGFPLSYELKGNQADQKKFIGNAVEVTMAKAFVTSLATAIKLLLNNKLKALPTLERMAIKEAIV